MLNLLSMLLNCADVERPRFSNDEIHPYLESQECDLVKFGLLRQAENLSSIMCDACADEHIEEVHFIGSLPDSPVRAYITCPELGRVEVAFERLKQWEVDFYSLAGYIAKSLNLAGDVREEVKGRIWSLGKFAIKGRFYDLILARGLNWNDAPKMINSFEKNLIKKNTLVIALGSLPAEEIGLNKKPPAIPLKSISQTDNGKLSIDKDSLIRFIADETDRSTIRNSHSFPTPEGTKWEDVTITMQEDCIEVYAKGKCRYYSFKEAGFEDRRRAYVPDSLWELLKIFATHVESLPSNRQMSDKALRNNLKQHINKLQKRLNDLIPGIEEPPIYFDQSEECYKTAFRIINAETVKLPALGITSWMDVSITEIQPSIIHVSIETKKKYAAKIYSGEKRAGRLKYEPAEKPDIFEKEFELHSIGLADENGNPDLKGKTLLSVLRNEGVVITSAKDKGMLALGKFLCDFFSFDKSPFDFNLHKNEWIALFNASSKVNPGKNNLSKLVF